MAISEVYVFDMDGTLLDTRAAVYSAYAEAARLLNIQNEWLKVRQSAWGLSATEWNCPPALHALKCKLYAEKYARTVTKGWAAEAHVAACKLRDQGKARIEIWTAASEEAVTALRIFFPESFVCDVLQTCANQRLKQQMFHDIYMQMVTYQDVALHYYDDNWEQSLAITKCCLPSVRLHMPPSKEII